MFIFGSRDCRKPCLVAGQPVDHEVGIPVDELHHTAFILHRVRARFIGGRADAESIFLNDTAVLIVGLVPNMRQFFEIVIDAFHRILVNQPFGGDHGFLRR